MRDWASKLAGAAARIAGCLHLVEHAASACPWTLPIAPKTVAAAWAIAEYLIPHAQAAFSLMGADPVRAQAEDILGWLRRIEGGAFSMRDCHQAFRRMTPAELLPSIDLLCEHGYLRLKPSQGSGPQGGRPQSPVYEVNPSLKHAAPAKPPFRKSVGEDQP